MKLPRLVLVVVSLLVLVPVPAAQALEKWFYQSTNLLVDKNIDELETLWKRAAAAGYTQVLLADSKFGRLKDMEGTRYGENVARVKRIAADLHLEIVPAVFPIGYSSDLLSQDVNLVEALPVKDVPLIIQGGMAQLDDPTAPRFPAEGFQNLKAWDFRDEAMAPEEGGILHVSGQGGNARIFKKLKVQPWRQYRVSVRIKTADFKGEPEIKVLAGQDKEAHDIQWAKLGTERTQDWQVHHVVFNSQEFTEVNLALGVWGYNGGDLWWSDPALEEVAFLNLVRRLGAPVTIKTADDGKVVDPQLYEPLADEKLGTTPWKGEYDVVHEPRALRGKFPDGTRLLASYYHAGIVMNNQAAICLSEPKTYELLRDQAQRMHALWGAKGYMMSHDEIRVMNWCEACQARHLTPGQLLADNVKRCTALLREVNPGGRIYVWSDMFDPNHNAVADPYYLVNGPITGSWEGLDKDVIVIPWYLDKAAKSLKFFAERGHRQILAGYYDSTPLNAIPWLTAAQPVSTSIQGIMYTTWERDYSQLEKFSQEIDQGSR